MLVARLVGPSDEVVGIERDPKSVAKARARVTEAGLHNVSFNESDVGEIPDGKPFDAAVGRFILMYLRLQRCAQFHNWCGREECLLFRSHTGFRSLRIWRSYLFGSQRPLSLTRQCAPLPITKWGRSFITQLWRLDCPSLPCAWNCRWGRNPTWHNGITIPYAACVRRGSSCTCPSSRWVALTPWCTGCKPRLQNRRLSRAGLHLSERGAAT
jgi:Methyltransferase domain